VWSPVGLRERFALSDSYAEVPLWPEPGKPVALSGLPGSSKSLLVAALREESDKVIAVFCADEIECDEWAEDLTLWSPERPDRPAPRLLSELELDELQRPEIASLVERRSILQALGPKSILLSDMSALMAPVAHPSKGKASTLQVEVGKEYSPKDLYQRLHGSGFRRMPQVLRPGEISHRGDVLDVWPFGDRAPLRIEFFDDELESLRRFDAEAQSSTETLKRAEITLGDGSGHKPGHEEEAPCFPLDLLDPDNTILLVVEPVRFEEQLSRFTLREGTVAAPVAAFQDGLKRFPAFSLSTLPQPHSLPMRCDTPPSTPVETGELKGRVFALARGNDRPLVILRSEAESQRLLRVARESNGGRESPLDVAVGSLARGFRIPELEVLVLNHGEFFGTGVARRRAVQGKPQHRVASRAIDSFFELSVGDLVVHAVHGVAKFVGIERTTRSHKDAEEDHLRLTFAGETEVLVPVSKIDLVQKYVGAGGQHKPKLDKLGGKSFARRKANVAQALRDMAADLLQVQVDRARSKGVAFPSEEPITDEFIAAFPYEDTPDQSKATEEIKGDLCGERPMDRLLCGDVGFGKTEVAMRAAFKAWQQRQAGRGARADDGAGRAARPDVPRPHGVVPHARRDVCHASKGQSQEGDPRGPERPAASTSSSARTRCSSKKVKLRGTRPLIVDEEQRFGVAAQGEDQGDACQRRRADADRNADPAHAAHVAARHQGHQLARRHRRPADSRSRPTSSNASRVVLRGDPARAAARRADVLLAQPGAVDRARRAPSSNSCPRRASRPARPDGREGARSTCGRTSHGQYDVLVCDDDHRSGHRHADGQHDPRGARRHVRPRRCTSCAAASDATSRRAHCLPVPSTDNDRSRPRPRTAAGDRALQRAGLGLLDRDARPGDPRRRQPARPGAESGTSPRSATTCTASSCRLRSSAARDPEQHPARATRAGRSRGRSTSTWASTPTFRRTTSRTKRCASASLRELDEAVDAAGACERILASLQDRFGRSARVRRATCSTCSWSSTSWAPSGMSGSALRASGSAGARRTTPGRGPQGSWLEPFEDVRPIDAEQDPPDRARQCAASPELRAGAAPRGLAR
jgi:hypothetical protein